MKSKITIFSIVIFLSVLIMVVSFGEQKAEWKGTIDEEKGVIIVKNPKMPIYSEDVFSLEEELSIGESEEGEEYMFSDMRHIAVSEDERIYILDYREAHFKVFNKDGKYLMTVGRPGQGPGELNRPRMISISQNELMIQELGNRRFSVFSLDGEFLRNVSTKETWVLYSRSDSRGNIIVTEGFMDPEFFSYKVKKFDAEMNLLAEIATSPAPDARKSINPFMPIAYWVIDKNDNIVYGYPKDYEIQIFNPKGTLIKKITKEYDPVEVTEEEKEEQIGDIPPELKSRYVFSKYHSAYYRFFLDDEGRIFIQTWEKVGNEDTYFHDVFDREGRYIAKIPLRMRPHICKKGKLYTIEEDEEGYQVVKRYKVSWRY